MSVRRYYLDATCPEESGTFVEHPDGEWVYHEDYAALQAERDRWREKCDAACAVLNQSRADRDRLAGEVERLREMLDAKKNNRMD